MRSKNSACNNALLLRKRVPFQNVIMIPGMFRHSKDLLFELQARFELWVARPRAANHANVFPELRLLPICPVTGLVHQYDPCLLSGAIQEVQAGRAFNCKVRVSRIAQKKSGNLRRCLLKRRLWLHWGVRTASALVSPAEQRQTDPNSCGKSGETTFRSDLILLLLLDLHSTRNFWTM